MALADRALAGVTPTDEAPTRVDLTDRLADVTPTSVTLTDGIPADEAEGVADPRQAGGATAGAVQEDGVQPDVAAADAVQEDGATQIDLTAIAVRGRTCRCAMDVSRNRLHKSPASVTHGLIEAGNWIIWRIVELPGRSTDADMICATNWTCIDMVILHDA